MVVLGADADKLPEQGQALRREDMVVLEIRVASNWKAEDMDREYRLIHKSLGPIREILIDGASELQNGAKAYAEWADHAVVIQRDATHYAATQVKSILGKDEKFQQVISQMGTTRSLVQQTELGFVSPPTPENKARFMNLSGIILWTLKYPEVCELRDRLVSFILTSESALQPGERLLLSTQLLESDFGQFKQLEGQHSKSGFTGLVSCIPLLHSPPTPKSVGESIEIPLVRQADLKSQE